MKEIIKKDILPLMALFGVTTATFCAIGTPDPLEVGAIAVPYPILIFLMLHE